MFPAFQGKDDYVSMIKLLGVFGVCVTLAAITACGSSDPVAPAPIPACRANNTGSLTVGNTSRGTAQRVVLDGATIATLGPGTSAAPQTLSAGATYTLEFYIANTNSYACTASLVTVAQCSATTRTCAFP